MNKTILVTVADDRFGRKEGLYGATQDRITRLFQEHPSLGIEPHPYKWEDIARSAFYQENKTLLDNTDSARNGVAYKPYAILTELKAIQDGEFLIYNDCSPEIWGTVAGLERFNIEIIKGLCIQNRDLLTVFAKWDIANIPPGGLGIATHKNFTLNRCMDKMGLMFYEDAYQCMSGMICLRKTPEVLALVEEWLSWNCIDECCALGWANIEKDATFWIEEVYKMPEPSMRKMGHRHDQSILGLLLARINQKFVQPIIADRMHPANFLQYCRSGFGYDFVECNPKLSIGDAVINKQGTELTVFQIVDGKYGVGQSEASQYLASRENLKLIDPSRRRI